MNASHTGNLALEQRRNACRIPEPVDAFGIEGGEASAVSNAISGVPLTEVVTVNLVQNRAAQRDNLTNVQW
jgi:hypothetical protein